MFDENARIVGSNEQIEDLKQENSIRPRWLKDYIGQDKAKEKLDIFIKSSLSRKNLLTMYSFKDLQVWERPPYQQ